MAIKASFLLGIFINEGCNFALKHAIREPRPVSGSHFQYIPLSFTFSLFHSLSYCVSLPVSSSLSLNYLSFCLFWLAFLQTCKNPVWSPSTECLPAMLSLWPSLPCSSPCSCLEGTNMMVCIELSPLYRLLLHGATSPRQTRCNSNKWPKYFTLVLLGESYF